MKSELLKSDFIPYAVHFGSTRINFGLSFRPRKTLSISVHPNLQVTVVAPEGEKIGVIKDRVKKKGRWILKQKNYFSEFQPRPKAKRYVSGESFRYLGRQYRLKVEQGIHQNVLLKNGFIIVTTPNKAKAKQTLDAWYRTQAKEHFDLSLQRCLPRFKRYQIRPSKIVLKAMAKRWGSCSHNGKITLNPELVKASSRCIDYVITHERCHLIVKDHSPAFFKVLNSVLPDWKKRKLLLEKSFSS